MIIDLVHNETWFKIELTWSYMGYYLSPEYKDIKKSIATCNKLIDVIDIKKNDIAYKNFRRLITEKLLSDSILEEYTDEIHSLIKKISKRVYFELNLKSKDDIIRPKTKSRLRSKRRFTQGTTISEELKKELAQEKSIDDKLLTAELCILLLKKEYKEIIRVRNNIFYSDSISDAPVSVERITSKAYLGLGDVNKAVESIENARAEKGRQAYLHKDIAEIYESVGNIKLATLYYYKYCLEAPDKKMINNTLLKLMELEKHDYNACKNYLNLYFLIHERNNWKIKQDKHDLKKQYDFGNGKEYDELLKNLTNYWKRYIEEYDDVKKYLGHVEKIGESGRFGFIQYYNDEGLSDSVYFKMPKKIKIELSYSVVFTIERSYDKAKHEYSNAAFIIEAHPEDYYYPDNYFNDMDDDIYPYYNYRSGLSSIANEMGMPDDDDALDNLENLYDS